MKYNRKILSITAFIIFMIYLTVGCSSKTNLEILNNLTLKEFSTGLSNKGTPASVCSIAYLGVMANSLCILTLNCSFNGKNDNEINTAIKKCRQSQKKFYSLMNKDYIDFNKCLKYWSNESLQKNKKGQIIIINSTLTPISIMKEAYKTLNMIDFISKIVKPEILCDLKISAYYCQAIVAGAKTASESNLVLITDTEKKEKLEKTITDISNNFNTAFSRVIKDLNI